MSQENNEVRVLLPSEKKQKLKKKCFPRGDNEVSNITYCRRLNTAGKVTFYLAVIGVLIGTGLGVDYVVNHKQREQANGASSLISIGLFVLVSLFFILHRSACFMIKPFSYVGPVLIKQDETKPQTKLGYDYYAEERGQCRNLSCSIL